MIRVRFHPAAEREVTDQAVWYRERSEVAEQGFLLELDAAIRAICEAPERYPKQSRGEHRYVFPRYPFALLYRVRPNEVVITAVAHHNRHPGYWRRRD
jgi:plasmid stabilization system protein ParE